MEQPLDLVRGPRPFTNQPILNHSRACVLEDANHWFKLLRCSLMFLGQVFAVETGIIGNTSAVLENEAHSGNVALVVNRFEFVVPPVLEGDYHICFSSIAIGFNRERFSAGFNSVLELSPQSLPDVLLEIAVSITCAGMRRMECGLLVGGSSNDVVKKSSVISNDHINVAFGVDIRVVSVRAFQKNCEITICIGRVRIF